MILHSYSKKRIKLENKIYFRLVLTLKEIFNNLHTGQQNYLNIKVRTQILIKNLKMIK